MFRGNIVMKGYLKNPAATRRPSQGGWFHSGDLGVLYPDGYIQLKDRSKDIIISGGENISSIEVEDVLYKHPAVADRAVVAKPDEKWGETPCAFIELSPATRRPPRSFSPGAATVSRATNVPRHIVFAEIPKTSTGKIQKFQAARLGQGRVRACRRVCEQKCDAAISQTKTAQTKNAQTKIAQTKTAAPRAAAARILAMIECGWP